MLPRSHLAGWLHLAPTAAALAPATRTLEHADARGEIPLIGRTEAEVSADIGSRLLAEGHHRVNFAIVAAGADLAPAAKRLYAIRDVTGTVESVDLITASILSKKLAAGLEALVLDVKCGSGAFMKTLEQAEALARALVTTAQGAGCMTTALITDMSQPLATAAGNALEVTEVMETPTPVSALLHAGVINAGGFLLIRFADVMLLAPGVLALLVMLIGAINYNLALGHALVFLLASLGLTGMVHSFRNLHRLRLLPRRGEQRGRRRRGQQRRSAPRREQPEL